MKISPKKQDFFFLFFRFGEPGSQMKTVAFKWSVENKQMLDSCKKKKKSPEKDCETFPLLVPPRPLNEYEIRTTTCTDLTHSLQSRN